MSLIEQAAKRLEELRRTGVVDTEPPAAAPAEASAAAVPTPEHAIHELSARGYGLNAAVAPTTAPAPTRARVKAATPQEDSPTPRLDLNFAALRSRGYVTPDTSRSQLADEYRIVKRPIVSNALGPAKVRNGNLVMVASALSGEGKTFTAVNLAMSLAMELDVTVVLVDGDTSHPDLPNILGVHNSPGLLDLLTRDDIEIGDVLVPTNVPNLSVLPAGKHHERATELLASEQMAAMLRELSTRYADRIIVFDSPPLLPTTEARVLANHMGQIVMVVAADSTRQHAVKLALAAIESCEIVLMLLNKADKTDFGSYYGYGSKYSQ